MTSWIPDLTVIEYPSAEALAVRLATDVATKLGNAIEVRGAGSLMVSGGSTPIPFFAALADCSIPWEKITICLVDERWVNPGHQDSNEKLVRDELLARGAANARFVSAYEEVESADAYVNAYNARLLTLLKEHGDGFDVTVLGMGTDFHTASLFPVVEAGASVVDSEISCDYLYPGAADDRLAVVTYPQSAPHTRIGLSVTGILKSRSVMLHITGEAKKEKLLEAMTVKNPLVAPVYAVMEHASPSVYWSQS